MVSPSKEVPAGFMFGQYGAGVGAFPGEAAAAAWSAQNFDPQAFAEAFARHQVERAGATAIKGAQRK